MAKAKSENQAWEAEETENKCSSCGNESVLRDYQRNILLCENCGRILKEDIKDMGPEWRAFNQSEHEEKSRAGPPSTETIHDKGLSTQIDWQNRDGRGQSLSPKRRSRMYRLRKWQKRIRVSGAKDRNLATALSEIDRMSSQLGLPKKVRESASKIYREAVDEDLIRGRSIESVSSAALYAACRENQIPRTLEEVAEVSRVDKKDIGQSYRLISRELNIDLPPTDPSRYVARFGSELKVSGEVRTKAIEIIRKAQEERLTSGKSPVGIAAAALYIAAVEKGERKTQREVAEVTDMTEVTVRNRYKELVEKLELDLDI
ncbi:transcription initiation factor IIB [candidate division MSBL1 archaeon SCGC-AAA259D14]|uniref:Transcription initiation factor IIB n=1 Tax=candidate division MSBL1 archaeon SCGC-AAA259D14 TaxID=1698261 RepID=A0A133U5C4_9EURY|nr:transcription initiation factor IIB [candidate division MSBL1 archaeon SCGC-AAA259D14]